MDKNFDIKFTKGSGPGGQHKNKVETCVVITHIPTGLQEKCQDTRSKERNLKIAKERLKGKIAENEKNIVEQKKAEKRKKLIETQKVVRTYNYTRNEVHDHRTKTKHDLKKFMRGEIDL